MAPEAGVNDQARQEKLRGRRSTNDERGGAAALRQARPIGLAKPLLPVKDSDDRSGAERILAVIGRKLGDFGLRPIGLVLIHQGNLPERGVRLLIEGNVEKRQETKNRNEEETETGSNRRSAGESTVRQRTEELTHEVHSPPQATPLKGIFNLTIIP